MIGLPIKGAFDLLARVDGVETPIASWTMHRYRDYYLLTPDPEGRYAQFEVTFDPPPREGADVQLWWVPR